MIDKLGMVWDEPGSGQQVSKERYTLLVKLSYFTV